MKKILRSLLLLTPALLLAQSAAIVRPPSAYNELKTFLGLSDTQLNSLFSIQDSRNQALQSIYTQINDKYTQLYSLLNAGTGTATQLGQLLLDIGVLQKQVSSDSAYRTQALAVLTPDQKTKLATLVQAMQLQTAVWQGVDLLLLDGSNPIPVDAGVGTGATSIALPNFSPGNAGPALLPGVSQRVLPAVRMAPSPVQ
jgi:hypothetical protein